MAQIVRRHGGGFRSAPLSKHVVYLKRHGVPRDGTDTRMFDTASYEANAKAFAERCEEDRHHSPAIIYPRERSPRRVAATINAGGRLSGKADDRLRDVEPPESNVVEVPSRHGVQLMFRDRP
jgi:type IV secretory pathway VirD2 relaxase